MQDEKNMRIHTLELLLRPRSYSVTASYVYQIMDRSRHTITEYLCDEKTHKAKREKNRSNLMLCKKDLYEVELLKSTIEHGEPKIVGFLFFIMPNSKCWS